MVLWIWVGKPSRWRCDAVTPALRELARLVGSVHWRQKTQLLSQESTLRPHAQVSPDTSHILISQESESPRRRYSYEEVGESD